MEKGILRFLESSFVPGLQHLIGREEISWGNFNFFFFFLGLLYMLPQYLLFKLEV